MIFADMHLHALYGVDDGPEKPEEMQKMVADAYLRGTRYFCFTPHCFPELFGDNTKKTEKAFQQLKAWAKEEYSDIRLFLGSELRHNAAALSWLNNGMCRTLGGTKHVLVDFSQDESKCTIVKGVYALLNSGYIPVLAHIERYRNLGCNSTEFISMSENGVLFQVDARALLGKSGFTEAARSRIFLSKGFVDIVSSDAHDGRARTADMSECYNYTVKRVGEEFADRIFLGNTLKVLGVGASLGLNEGYYYGIKEG